MASLQAGIWTTSDAMGRGVRDLEEERMWLERGVTAGLAHHEEAAHLAAQDMLHKIFEMKIEKGGEG